MPASASFLAIRSIASSTADFRGFSSLIQFSIADPDGVSDGHRQIREEVPADIRRLAGCGRNGAAELGVVAERQAYDARTVAVVRDPRRPLGDGQQRIESHADLAE